MKNRIHFAITLAGAVLCALPNLAIAQSGPGDSQGGQAAAIEGTWIVSIHRVVTGVTFSALQSFTAGGVTVATGTIDRTPPPPISPLYGSWRRLDNNSYAVTINFFIFDASGNAVGMLQNNETFRLTDDNNVVGSGTAFFCDINGNNCVNVNSPITITGKRLIAQGSN
ncbi:MAG TPA: hypothetical protein VKV15_19000 [Bryobacteraceae bacterium]|nr:hypothetical protein [Bryobacteraceae bacterium]